MNTLNQSVNNISLLDYYRDAKQLGYAPSRCREYAINTYARRNNKRIAEVRAVLKNILNKPVEVPSHVTG